MSKSRVVSTRMTAEDLAKALDGLIDKGIDPAERSTTSQILRLTFYYGIIYLCDEPKTPPSQESLSFIRQKFGQTKLTKSLNLS